MNRLNDSFFSRTITTCHALLIPVYSFFFLIGIRPFGIEEVLQITVGQLAFRAAIITAIEFVVILISRMSMLLLRERLKLSLAQYIVWELFEVLVIAMFSALFIWLMARRVEPYVYYLQYMSLITFSVLLFPYILVVLYSVILGKNNMIDSLEVQLDRYRKGLVGKEESTLSFFDDRNSLKLAVTSRNVLFIEAADNYVNVNFIKNDKLVRFPLRNSMNSIERICMENNLVRCHRSYYVNLRRIRSISKESHQTFAELDFPGTPRIPVSGKYSESVIGLFSNLNS